MDSSDICENCVYGKTHRLKSGSRKPANVSKPGDVFSADVCGLFDESFGKYPYYVLFKDHFSKIKFLVYFNRKSDVTEALKDVVAKVKKQGHVIKEFLCDNRGEFDNERVREVLRMGITRKLTAPRIRHNKWLQ